MKLLLAFIVVGLALQGCASTSARPGVFLASIAGGAPGWMGEPDGIPVWSPNGDAIAWGGEDGIFLATLDKEGAIRLAEGAIVGRPAWSPDGFDLAYVDRGSSSLVALDVKSGKVRFRVPIKNDDAQSDPLGLVTLGGPAWSPDGARVAFNCWDGNGDEICIVDRDGGGRWQVTRLAPANRTESGTLVPVSNVGPPAWSPDGATLAVAAYPERRGATSGVFVVDVAQGKARRISTLLPNSEIRWFPDGSSLLFSATTEGRSDVEVVAVDDGAARTLTASLPQGSRNPDPAPDGQRVAVASGRGIVILDATGTELGLIDSGWRDRYPAWSPDGMAVAFAADRNPILSYD
jgi:Tol biopolymer transport system component